MNAYEGENNVNFAGRLLRTRQNNDFTLGIGSQTFSLCYGLWGIDGKV